MKDTGYSRHLIRFESGLFVFSWAYLVESHRLILDVIPQQVWCEQGSGVFKDYGCGIYAYQPLSASDKPIVLRCILNQFSFCVRCHLYKGVAIPVPKQFQLKPAVINSIAHSVLPDGTVVIPRTQLMDAVNHEISVSNKASISKAIPITTGYSCHLSSDFCVIASTRVEHGRLVYSTKCQLEVEISSIDSIHTSSTIVDIDMNVMNQLMIKTFNFNELNGCLQQTDLLDLVSTCQSPILFADVVYELQGRRYLKANENGSFTLPDKPEYSGLDCAYVYGISDAVEYVNIAVAIPIEILASLHYSLDRALYSSNLKMLVQRELLGF